MDGNSKSNGQRVVNRSQLINQISDDLKLSRRDVHVSVKHILDLIGEALRNERRVELRRLCSFSTRKRDARVLRNPRTNEKVFVPVRNIAHFKPSKRLRILVDGKQK